MKNKQLNPNYTRRNLTFSIISAATLGAGCSNPIQREVIKPARPTRPIYRELDPPIFQSNPVAERPVEVVEFFKFGCSYCIDFEKCFYPWLESNAAKVNFRKEAPDFGRSWEGGARLFYASQLLDVPYQLHHKIERFLRSTSAEDKTPEKIGDYIQSLMPNFEKEQLPKTLQSFSVNSLIKRGTHLTYRADIKAVPSLLVNGKYVVQTNGSENVYDNMVEAVAMLVERSRSS